MFFSNGTAVSWASSAAWVAAAEASTAQRRATLFSEELCAAVCHVALRAVLLPSLGGALSPKSERESSRNKPNSTIELFRSVPIGVRMDETCEYSSIYATVIPPSAKQCLV